MSKELTGWQKILKLYGEVKVTDKEGKIVTWVWDKKNDSPKIKDDKKRKEIINE